MLAVRRCRNLLLAAAAVGAWLAAAPAGSLSAAAGVSGATVAAASDPVVATAGDIACDPASSKFNGGKGTSSACRKLATSNLIAADSSIAAVLPLGDNQYECGGYQAYLKSYDPSWGRFLAMTHPVPGNHEYQTSGGTDCSSGAAGYFRYFGAAAGDSRGDYARNLGTWHLIALNGNCGKVGGCGSGSPQGNFLKQNLGSAAPAHVRPVRASGRRRPRGLEPRDPAVHRRHRRREPVLAQRQPQRPEDQQDVRHTQARAPPHQLRLAVCEYERRHAGFRIGAMPLTAASP